MKVLFPKGYRIELQMPDGLDGKAIGFYEETIDIAQVREMFGDDWETALDKQIEMMRTLNPETTIKWKDDVITVDFTGLPVESALNHIAAEFLGISTFGRTSLAEVFAKFAALLAETKASKEGVALD